MFKLPVQIKEQITDYEAAINEFISGRMSWARFAGIRVPWGNYSHRGGKQFMARIRIPAGVLTPKQLGALAACARDYGNGVLHITTRQDIQIHEVKIESIIKIHQYLKDQELSSRGGGGNTVRNITACPLAGICDKEVFDVRGDAVALSEYLLAEESSYNLPRKFKIGFSGCSLDCACALVNDVGLFALPQGAKAGYRVYAGGGMGAKPALGKLLEEFIQREDLGTVIAAIKNVFYKYGDRRNKHHNRLRFLIEGMGFDKFREYYQKELTGIKNSAHIHLRKEKFSYPEAKSEKPPETKDRDFKEFLKYNCLEQKQEGFNLVKLRVPRGDLEWSKAAALAGLEDEFKQIEFRTSREQDLFIANISRKDLYKFYVRIKSILRDFLYPQTLLDVVACKGSLTCNLGLCNSPGLAREIEALIQKEFMGTKIFAKLTVKINGCPNACGHHPVGIVSFHGAARKVSGHAAPFYKLFLGGRVGLEDTRLARDTNILIPAKNVPLFLRDFLKQIDGDIKDDTDIYKYIEEKGGALAKEAAGNYSHIPAYTENKGFYTDWGKQEEFSLEGLGPGECGAGVLDMIEADLSDAKIALDAGDMKKALFLSARALLVVKGIDPRTEDEAFSGFVDKFVKENIASSDYGDLKNAFYSEKLDLAYANKFLSHIKELYKKMDSSFNFPKLEKEVNAQASIARLLDLKGTACPINYVKAKLFIENLNAGDIVEIFLDEGEPIRNVPKSLKDDGHEVLKIEKQDGFYKVTVRKTK